jgi:SPP1 gp7 family putative phage head morphogenesis protein
MGEQAKTDPLGTFGEESTPYNPSELITRRGMKVLEEMRDDDQIKAAMSFKKHAVLVGGWEIVSPQDKAPDWEVTEFVDWNLRHMGAMSDTFDESLLAILSALDFGYSVSELVWDNIDTPHGNRAVIKAIKSKHPEAFDFKTDEYGNLEYLLQHDGSYTSAGDGKRLDPEKFVIYSYNKEFGNFYGKSDLIAAYRAWWIKSNVYRWMAMYMERLGVPPVFALYDPTSYNKKQKDDLKNVIMNFQAATSGIIPRPARPDAKAEDVLSFWTPELASQIRDVFVPILAMLNHDASRALLVPGEIGATPDSAQGSFARSKKHFDAFLMIVAYQRSRVSESVIQEQVVKRLVDFNYPNIEEYPQFRLLAPADDVQFELLTTFNDLVEKGVVVAQEDDEDHIRTLMKFPDRDPERPEPIVEEGDIAPSEDDKDEQGANKSVSDKEKTAAQLAKAIQDKIKEDKIKKDTDAKLAELMSATSIEDRTPAINPTNDPLELPPTQTTNNDRDDLTGVADASFADRPAKYKRLERDLDGLEAQAQKQLVPTFLTVRDSMIDFVGRNWEKDIINKMKDYRLRNFAPVRSTMRELLHTSLRLGMATMKEELKGVKPAQFASIQLTPVQAIKWLDQWEDFAVSGAIKTDITEGTRTIIMNALKDGSTLKDTQAKLGKLFEPFVGNPNVLRPDKDGVMRLITPHRLETIIRTNTTNAFNQGRLIEARQNDDLVQGMEYSAIIDNRTTEICRHLDGKKYRLDDPDLNAISPPNHFNCRSILVPITITKKVNEKDWINSKDKGIAGDLADPGFGGKVSGAPMAPSVPKGNK